LFFFPGSGAQPIRRHPAKIIAPNIIFTFPASINTSMNFSKMAESLTLLVLCCTTIIAASISQGAGAGAGCDGM
jgi:hypothetical protein